MVRPGKKSVSGNSKRKSRYSYSAASIALSPEPLGAVPFKTRSDNVSIHSEGVARQHQQDNAATPAHTG
jgi:hypothetical protein